MFELTGSRAYATQLSSWLVVVVVQLLSHIRLFAISWTAAHQASLSFIISQSLLKLTSIESVVLSNHFVLFRPLLLLPSVFPSFRVFSKESALHIRWPKYWSFNISPFNEYSELIYFRIDWFDLVVQIFYLFESFEMLPRSSTSPLGFQNVKLTYKSSLL